MSYQNKLVSKPVRYGIGSESDLQNAVLITLPNNQVSIPATTYFIEVEQSDDAYIGINNEGAKYLTINNIDVINESGEFKLITYDERLKTQSEKVKYPLGSSENPIQILHEDGKIMSTQNISKAQLQLIANALQAEEKCMTNTNRSADNNFIYKVVYPEELDLKRVLNEQGKRGRPKKRPPLPKDATEEPEKTVKNVRTRSGRITRPPRHIEKDFKKIEISEHDENEMEVVTTDFTPIQSHNAESENKQPILTEPLQNHQKKRNISAQYKCPTCKKAYMGRSRMIKHLQKNPEHGPLPQHCKNKNFDTWNYLVDITQKSPPGTKGVKFCEELSNLLNNLKILTKSLFKTATEDDNNSVRVDAVLGDVLNLTPGNYKFNESELCKDVSLFKLLEDNKFFDETPQNKVILNDAASANKGPAIMKKIDEQKDKFLVNVNKEQNETHDISSLSENNVLYSSDYINENISLELSGLSNDKDNLENEKKVTNQNLIRSDLLSDNSLLSSLPNLRNSVDDLMLPVDAGPVSHLLDNSISSDEVMNVDQFVNERFKKITEPDIELHNSINLDLHSLDLFNFNSS